MKPDHTNTVRPSKPQYIIDVDYEKRFFNSHGSDYCKICTERFHKITGTRRCHICITGTTQPIEAKEYMPNRRYIFINCYCIIQCNKMDQGDKRVERRITLGDLREIYEQV